VASRVNEKRTAASLHRCSALASSLADACAVSARGSEDPAVCRCAKGQLAETGEQSGSLPWTLFKHRHRGIDYIDSANNDTDDSSAFGAPLSWSKQILNIIDFTPHYFIENNKDNAHH